MTTMNNQIDVIFDSWLANIERAKSELPNVVHSAIMNNFNTQSFFGQKWVVSQIEPTLYKSGTLKNSIKVRLEGNTVVVSSDVVYSRIHNYGGKIGGHSGITATGITIPKRTYIGGHPVLIELIKNTLTKYV